MNFKELVQQLEERIGYHQMPINPFARGTRDLFESCPVHHELMADLMRAIFKANGCRKLTDSVRRLDTFHAIEPIRLRVLRSARADVDQVQLIENLCSAIDQVFDSGGREHRPQPPSREKRTAEVIPLERFRYRRWA